MQAQEIKFAVQEENGIVTKIGRSTVFQPKAGSIGGKGVGWYKDRNKAGKAMGREGRGNKNGSDFI